MNSKEKSDQINCSNCAGLGKCETPLICIRLNYVHFFPANKSFCQDCKVKDLTGCGRHAEPCWKQEWDESKLDINWQDYEKYYYDAILYFSELTNLWRYKKCHLKNS